VTDKELLPRTKILPKVEIPIVEVRLPAFELPEFPPKIPKLDDRQQEIMRHTVLEDLSDLIPVIGDTIADLHYAKIKELMSSEEYEEFVEQNKTLPSSLAALKVFAKKK